MVPVVLFVYSRPFHTEEVLKSLAACTYANETPLYIYSDAPKKESAAEAVAQVRAIINDEKWKAAFASVTIVAAEKNKGLARSIISGVTQVISEHGRIIVVEDDNRLAPDFLDYMNRALDFYENDKHIGEIGAYCAPLKFPVDYQHDVFAMGRGSSYAWASWKDRWEIIDWEVKDFDDLKKDKKRIRAFNEYGEDLFGMLEAQVSGRMDSWAIRSAYAKFKANQICIMPVETRVENIGFDSTGVHNVAADTRFNVKIKEDLKPVVFANVSIDPRIKKEFVKLFKAPVIVKIKRTIKKVLSLK